MINQAFALLSSPLFLTVAGTLAAVTIIVWDWRLALLTLLVAQGTIGAATVQLMQVPVEWVLIQTAVMALSCLILGMSAAQVMKSSPTSRQSGNLWLRLMAVLLLYGGWRLLDIHLTLPDMSGEAVQLIAWLAFCALLMLGLGASPLFSGVAILLWIVTIQAFVAAVLEIPSLVALVGILEVLVALACSYLLIAESLPVKRERMVLSDVAFPEPPATAEEDFGLATITGSLAATMRRRWANRTGGDASTAARPGGGADSERTSGESRNDEAETVTDRHAARQSGS